MKNRSRRDKLMVLPEVGDWPKTRYGVDQSIAMSAIQGALLRMQPRQKTKPVVMVPGTPPVPRPDPSERLAKVLGPISYQPPQVVDHFRTVARIDGSRWADATVAASKVAAEEGLGLDIQIGLGDRIFLFPDHIVTATFRFRLPEM